VLASCRHKTRLHIGQLVKDTSNKLKQASEIDHNAEVNVMPSTLIQNAKRLRLVCVLIRFCNE